MAPPAGMPRPGLLVSLLIDDLPAEEYPDRDARPSAVHKSKYVEARSGANFAVMMIHHQSLQPDPRDHLLVYVLLDGVIGSSNILAIDSSSRDPRIIKGSFRNTVKGTVFEEFKFGDLQTHDGPVGKAKYDDFKHLGEITVRFVWVRPVGSPYVCLNKRSESTIGLGVPEKCLKGRAISSHATFGPATLEKRQQPSKTQAVEYPYSKDHFAVFNFKYRSRRELQIEGVIPRSPSPPPLEERDPEDLTLEESRELVRRLREREKEQIRIKKEGERVTKRVKRARSIDPDDSDSDVEVVSEGPSRKRTRNSTETEVVVIDLTED